MLLGEVNARVEKINDDIQEITNFICRCDCALDGKGHNSLLDKLFNLIDKHSTYLMLSDSADGHEVDLGNVTLSLGRAKRYLESVRNKISLLDRVSDLNSDSVNSVTLLNKKLAFMEEAAIIENKINELSWTLEVE